MTDADLHAIAAALEAERARRAASILAVVGRELAAAHAHAVKAVTETLRATPDGRPTIRRANRNPSFKAALGHLDDLLTRLAGPSAVSLDGAVRDAREAFYRLAFRLHTPHMPEALRVRKEPQPTRANLDLVRGAALHGYDVRTELEAPFAVAARTLKAAVATAGSPAVSRAIGDQALKNWHDRAARSIGPAVLSLLSDSAEHANTEAMADLVHPDFRAEPATA
jgi:hypothetical protein